MILLDTDHLSILRFRSSDRGQKLVERLRASADLSIGTTIINVEESMRGWMATLAKERQIERQIPAYRELADLFALFAGLHIALFDVVAATEYGRLKSMKLKVGTMDLKTASIAITHNAILLTANRRDFEQIPGLKFENWLDG
jgi:tRNA(fMet)-specific endonuclease VapC